MESLSQRTESTPNGHIFHLRVLHYINNAPLGSSYRKNCAFPSNLILSPLLVINIKNVPAN